MAPVLEHKPGLIVLTVHRHHCRLQKEEKGMGSLRQVDPEVSHAIELEKKRLQERINLIASENYPSRAVLEAQGSFLTAKYAEGYPRHRHYPGCENVDIVEDLAIERAKAVFHAEHANVQPHAGAQANMAAYYATLEHGDTIMGMSLAHGGHLTHGADVNFSGKLYKVVSYGVDRETERIDYRELERLAVAHRPKLIVAGFSAYPRLIDFERFRQIADRVGAMLMADIAHIAGMVAVGLHPTPVPYCDIVTSTTHKTLRGPRGGFILCRRALASAVDRAVFPQMQGGPLMHIIAAKAVAFHEAMQPEFFAYQRAILDNAQVLASELIRMGLRLVAGGTDTHLLLVDLTRIGFSGKKAEEALGKAGIVANHNLIPFDPRPQAATSGIRLGTPAITTRGFGTEEIKFIASAVVRVLGHIDDAGLQQQIAQEVKDLCLRFPVPALED
jgi:glycine hydroxymethyltransferase